MCLVTRVHEQHKFEASTTNASTFQWPKSSSPGGGGGGGGGGVGAAGMGTPARGEYSKSKDLYGDRGNGVLPNSERFDSASAYKSIFQAPSPTAPGSPLGCFPLYPANASNPPLLPSRRTGPFSFPLLQLTLSAFFQPQGRNSLPAGTQRARQ